MQKYIDLQGAVIDWYRLRNPDQTPECYVPTRDDLQKLIAGKKIGEEATAAAKEGGEEADEEEEAVSGDASIRIASLQSQLEKEKQQNKMLKDNFDADMKDMERKLAEALANQKEQGDGDNNGEGVADEKVLFELQQVRKERDAYKKQLLIAMGEDPESSSEYYEDDDEEEEGKAKPEKKEKVDFVFGGKKVAELQKRAEELELAN